MERGIIDKPPARQGLKIMWGQKTPFLLIPKTGSARENR
jgi:hypothetical protein